MELKLLRSTDNVVRVVVMGKITRDGWLTTDDPLGDLYGKDVYRRTVLLNLTESLYIDSTGVEWLLICHRRFEEKGGMLIVHSVNPLAKQLLKMMGMDSILHIVDDEASAHVLAKKHDNQQVPDSQLTQQRKESHVENAGNTPQEPIPETGNQPDGSIRQPAQ